MPVKFLSNLSAQQKKLLNVALAFVFLAIFVNLFLFPVLGKLSLVEEEIGRQKTDIVRDLRFLSYKDKITKEVDTFEPYFTKDLLDEDVVNAQFLSEVESLASQSTVSLVKSTPAETKKEKHYLEYSINIDCTAELKDMLGFMYSINSSEDLLKVAKFNMTPQRGETTKVNASMTIVKRIVLAS